MRQSNTNLYGLVRNNYILAVGSEKGSVVSKGRDRVTPIVHDIVLRVISDCKVEEIMLVNACLSEDCTPMSPLFVGGTPNVVFNKSFEGDLQGNL